MKKILKKNKLLMYTYKAIRGYKIPQVYDCVTSMGRGKMGDLKIENVGWGRELIYNIAVAENSSYGFFSLYFSVLSGLAYADFLRLKPYVSYSKNCPYSEKELFLGTDNAFEYYFEPVSDVKQLTEEYSIIKFHGEDRRYLNLDITDREKVAYDFSGEKERTYIDRLASIAEKYIRFNQYTAKILEKDIQNLLKGKKTLGVHARGGEWRNPVKGHPVAVTLDEHIEHVRRIINEFGFQQIFLATDEVEAIEAFKSEFGNAVVYYEDTFRGNEGQWLLGMQACRENHNYKLGLEVLRDAETLVYCDGLIAGLSNISRYVELKQIMLERKVVYSHIVNKGTNDRGRSVSDVVKEMSNKKS